MQGIDFTSVHLYTDFYGVGDLEGQLQWVERNLQAHMNISEALQKPLIITEWGKLPPLPERNAFSKFIYDLATQSAMEGGVLAGAPAEISVTCTSFLLSLPLRALAPVCVSHLKLHQVKLLWPDFDIVIILIKALKLW